MTAFLVIYSLTQYEQLLSSEQVTFSDLLAVLFWGQRANYVSRLEQPFQVPLIWLLFNIWQLFALCLFLRPAPKTLAIYEQLALSKRGHWWWQRCLTSLFYTLLSYLVIVICCGGVLVVVKGHFSFNVTVTFQQVFGLERQHLSEGELLVRLGLLPFITSLTLGQLLVLLDLYRSLVESFLLLVILLLGSVFYSSGWLIGNYLMISRNEDLIGNGYSTYFGFGWLLVLNVAILGIGGFKIKTYDHF